MRLAGSLTRSDSDGHDPREHCTLADVAYRSLRRDVMTGVFAPGQPLRLELLKARYGCSFSPLREALNRLQSERLVVAVAARGFSVAPLSFVEMWDAVNTRILIECEALRRSMRQGGDDWEAQIVATFHALDLIAKRTSGIPRPLSADDLEALETRHHDFHRALIATCGSDRLLGIADQLYAETERYRRPTLTGGPGDGSRNIAGEHHGLMTAVLARSEQEAVASLSAHYRKTAEFIDKNFSDHGRL